MTNELVTTWWFYKHNYIHIAQCSCLLFRFKIYSDVLFRFKTHLICKSPRLIVLIAVVVSFTPWILGGPCLLVLVSTGVSVDQKGIKMHECVPHRNYFTFSSSLFSLTNFFDILFLLWRFCAISQTMQKTGIRFNILLSFINKEECRWIHYFFFQNVKKTQNLNFQIKP